MIHILFSVFIALLVLGPITFSSQPSTVRALMCPFYFWLWRRTNEQKKDIRLISLERFYFTTFLLEFPSLAQCSWHMFCRCFLSLLRWKNKGYLEVFINPALFDVQHHSMASHEGYTQIGHLLCKCQNQLEIKGRAKQVRWKASRYFRTPSFVSLSSQNTDICNIPTPT